MKKFMEVTDSGEFHEDEILKTRNYFFSWLLNLKVSPNPTLQRFAFQYIMYIMFGRLRGRRNVMYAVASILR